MELPKTREDETDINDGDMETYKQQLREMACLMQQKPVLETLVDWRRGAADQVHTMVHTELIKLAGPGGTVAFRNGRKRATDSIAEIRHALL